MTKKKKAMKLLKGMTPLEFWKSNECKKYISKLASPNAKVLIGPVALIYKDDIWSIFVVTSPGHLNCIDLGECEDNPLDESDPLFSAFDNVLSVSRADTLTAEEAEECRASLIAMFREIFEDVTAYDSALLFAEAWVSYFPSEKSNRMLSTIQIPPKE